MFQSPMFRSQSSIRLSRSRASTRRWRWRRASAPGPRHEIMIVRDSEDERRRAAPAHRVAMDDRTVLDDAPAPVELDDDGRPRPLPCFDLRTRRSPRRSVRPRRSERAPSRPCTFDSSKSSDPAPRRCARCRCPPRARPRPTGSRGARPLPAPADRRRTLVLGPDEGTLTAHGAHTNASADSVRRRPIRRSRASRTPRRLDRRGDVRRRRPRRRRPDHQRLAGPVLRRKRTKSDGCVISSYELISSCWESDVPQRGHHSVERCPR